jgi:hypothetical protein
MRFVTALSFLGLSVSPPAQTPVQVAQFHAIEAGNGAHVTVRYGATQRVTMVKGSKEYSRISVTRGGTLLIDNCPDHCPRGYELEIEIVTPILSSVSLTSGGRIEGRGTFPRQAEIDVDVAHGGTIDIRPLVVDRVTASVNQGGRILTVSETSLVATVNQGGFIAYWGHAKVSSSISHGGVVTEGDPRQIGTPLSDVDQE